MMGVIVHGWWFGGPDDGGDVVPASAAYDGGGLVLVVRVVNIWGFRNDLWAIVGVLVGPGRPTRCPH